MKKTVPKLISLKKKKKKDTFVNASCSTLSIRTLMGSERRPAHYISDRNKLLRKCYAGNKETCNQNSFNILYMGTFQSTEGTAAIKVRLLSNVNTEMVGRYGFQSISLQPYITYRVQRSTRVT